MKNKILLLTALFVLGACATQNTKNNIQNNPKVVTNTTHIQPKLVVGIVVDQMRYDYLNLFWDKYGEGGFKRLINEGFNCKNNHFNYIPTYTAPGHASVYTGTTPAVHGIIGNNWYDKTQDKSVYCVYDENYASVGTTASAGKMSPHQLTTTTITDQLRLATQMQGKVVAVSIKDRGAVLPAGHTGKAFWFHGKNEGIWITSTFYSNVLPKWVVDFNNAKKADAYKKPWNTLFNIETYTESGADSNNYERSFNGQPKAVFPHNLPELWDENGGYDILKSTPYGNSLTLDFALAAIDGEQLGADNITDFLAISFSSTDYVGHQFGVNSKEVQDTYVRLDRDLERLLTELDAKLGKDNYTVFLTSDHGAVHVPSYLQDHKIPGGYLNSSEDLKRLKDFLTFKFGTSDLIKNISNNQIFLNKELINNLELDLNKVEQAIVNELLTYGPYMAAYTGSSMQSKEFTEGVAGMLQNGYHMQRSGDILLVPAPAHISYSKTGSTHGSGFMYDTHVPLIFYGKGVKQGSTTRKTVIPDVAPTIATLLGISFPNGATGTPIFEILED